MKTKALAIVPKSLKDQWQENTQIFNLDVLTKEEFKRTAGTLPKYEAIIIDEAHYFSGMQNLRKRSGLLKSLLAYIKKYNPNHIYLLTGTPYLSSPLNIFAYSEILGHKWDYNRFKATFFSQVNMGRRFPVPVIRKHVDWNGQKMSVEQAISICVAMLGSTVRMNECVDVPEQIFQTEYFSLSKEQKEAIENLTDEAAIARWTKTHQICGGTLKGDGYIEDQIYKSEKLERIVELAGEHKKLIIVCRYNHEIDTIAKKILSKHKHKTVITINGDSRNRHALVEKADKGSEAIVIVNAACSEGYELPSFPLMVFYSYDFSLKNYIQMKGRIQRINNIKKNVYLSLVVKGSIDEDVYKCIKNKESFDVSIYGKNK